jgi:multiple sugar transport system substrate-binding protein
MKKIIRRVLVFAMASVMAIGVVGCGDGEKNTHSSNTDLAETHSAAQPEKTSGTESGDVTLRITWWGSDSRHAYTQKLLDKYTEEHSNIHFEATPSGWDGYFEKLATDTATGSMPDIVQMDYLYLATYASNHSLADLNSYFDDKTIDINKVDENILNSGKINDVQVAMPLSTSLLSIGYSPAELKKAGLEEPNSEWTWSDFAEMCKTITQKTGDLGTSNGPVDDTNQFNYWVRQHGAQLFADDNKSLGFEDDNITADYFTFWKDLIDANAAPDPDEYNQITTLGLEGGPITTDSTGFVISWNNISNLLSTVNPNVKLMTPPLSDDSNGSLGLWLKPGMFFSIAQTSDYPEKAAEFINWFVNSKEANDIIMGERGTPVSSEIREYLVNSGKLSSQQQDMFNYVDEATKFCGDTPEPDPVGISEINQTFKDCAYSVFYGQSSAEEAAKSFRDQANSILASNN